MSRPDRLEHPPIPLEVVLHVDGGRAIVSDRPGGVVITIEPIGNDNVMLAPDDLPLLSQSVRFIEETRGRS